MKQKNLTFIAVFLLLASILTPSQIFAQSENQSSEEYYPAPVLFAKEKSIFGDIGYFGPGGLSLGVGARYWFASLELGLSGFAKSVPNYSMNSYDVKITPSQPLPAGYVEDKYTKILVTADLGFYVDILDPFIIFASVGFYSQQDTILAKEFNSDVRYYYKYYNSSGVAFGVGANYVLNDVFEIGLGYHTKRGVFARVTYYWF